MNNRTGLVFLGFLLVSLMAVEVKAGILSADLSITKVGSPAIAVPGEAITYTITVGNAGPEDASGTVADNFPAGLSCAWTCTASAGSSCTAVGVGNINDIANVIVGGNATYSAVCDIDPAATGALANTATVTPDASITDPDQTNNSDSENTTLQPTADLSITKTDGQTGSTPGTPISYTIVASNAGPSAVTDAVVGDTFVAALQNCSWTSAAAGGASGNTNGSGNLLDTLAMPVGSSVTYTVDCDIDPAATGTLENIASIESTIATDPATGNNSANDTNTLGAVADLSITKTDNQVVHTAGDPIAYVIVASNAGPSTVSDAVVSDIFLAPLQNCSWTSVAAGGASGNSNASGDLNDVLVMPAGSSVRYDVICDVAPDGQGVLSNTATIDSATADDPTPGNASATDNDTVLFSALPVPTLGSGALAILLALLALIGIGALNRRMS